jgi:hypothetical protein
VIIPARQKKSRGFFRPLLWLGAGVFEQELSEGLERTERRCVRRREAKRSIESLIATWGMGLVNDWRIGAGFRREWMKAGEFFGQGNGVDRLIGQVTRGVA